MTEPGESDLWLGGRLTLRQPPRGAHRAGTDAVLLARLFEPGDGALVYDLGAGTGAVGLAYARLSPSCRVVLVERDPALAASAAANARDNGLADRVSVIEADLLAPASRRREAGLLAAGADIVVTNPPFFERGRHRASPNPDRVSAHAFGEGDLDRWLRTCADLLRPGGRFGLIHRADALPACLDALRNRFGGITVRPVHARAGASAIRILVSAAKGSRAAFALAPPLVLHDASGRITPEAEALHRGEPSPL